MKPGPRFQQPKAVLLMNLYLRLEELDAGRFKSNQPEKTRERLKKRIADMEAKGVVAADPLARRVITGTRGNY